MPLKKEQKVEAVKELTDVFKGANSSVFVHFGGLSVAQANEMRAGMREQGVQYKVVKKTLTKRALEAAKPEGERPSFEGELAVAWGDDFIAPAREVRRFAKEFGDAVSIMGGIFDGRYMSRAEMEDVASIPPLQTLYGQFANVINSPIQGLAVALGQIAEARS